MQKFENAFVILLDENDLTVSAQRHIHAASQANWYDFTTMSQEDYRMAHIVIFQMNGASKVLKNKRTNDLFKENNL